MSARATSPCSPRGPGRSPPSTRPCPATGWSSASRSGRRGWWRPWSAGPTCRAAPSGTGRRRALLRRPARRHGAPPQRADRPLPHPVPADGAGTGAGGRVDPARWPAAGRPALPGPAGRRRPATRGRRRGPRPRSGGVAADLPAWVGSWTWPPPPVLSADPAHRQRARRVPAAGRGQCRRPAAYGLLGVIERVCGRRSSACWPSTTWSKTASTPGRSTRSRAAAAGAAGACRRAAVAGAGRGPSEAGGSPASPQ